MNDNVYTPIDEEDLQDTETNEVHRPEDPLHIADPDTNKLTRILNEDATTVTQIG